MIFCCEAGQLDESHFTEECVHLGPHVFTHIYNGLAGMTGWQRDGLRTALILTHQWTLDVWKIGQEIVTHKQTKIEGKSRSYCL